jgi:hypothetical protein
MHGSAGQATATRRIEEFLSYGSPQYWAASCQGEQWSGLRKKLGRLSRELRRMPLPPLRQSEHGHDLDRDGGRSAQSSHCWFRPPGRCPSSFSPAETLLGSPLAMLGVRAGRDYPNQIPQASSGRYNHVEPGGVRGESWVRLDGKVVWVPEAPGSAFASKLSRISTTLESFSDVLRNKPFRTRFDLR